MPVSHLTDMIYSTADITEFLLGYPAPYTFSCMYQNLGQKGFCNSEVFPQNFNKALLLT